MPKDWKLHKAELERLYTKEGKPLEEVRDIFREEHGFNASLRSYRMRVDTWGLRNDSSPRSIHRPRRPTPVVTSGANQIITDTLSHGMETSEARQVLPTVALRADQPVPSKQGPFEVVTAFETLLSRWQPRTESALLCFHHPDFNEWVKRSNPDQGPIVFKLIEALVPLEEQFMLNKAFLEADLQSHNDVDYPYQAWRFAWSTVLRCEEPEEVDDEEREATYCSVDWEHAKELLSEDEVISQVAGEKFMECALVVVAERRLLACKNDPHHWNRRKYLDILKDFRHVDADVDPSFYKGSLQIIELEEIESAQQSKHKRADLADEYRHKYLQLVNRYAHMKRSISQAAAPPGSMASPALTTEQCPSPCTSASAPLTNEPSEISSPSLPSTNTVFETLVSKWKTLNDFTEYAHSVLTHDGWSISIFEPCPTGATNLFDQISTSLPAPERIPLVSALLVAFSSLPLTAFYSPWCLHWWDSVYASPTWEKFQTRLDLERTTTQLERLMSSAAAKLFIDAAVLLVGERLLLRIKTRLVNAKRRASEDAEARAQIKRWEWQYMAILREFYAREMKVDQTWTYYLMNVL